MNLWLVYLVILGALLFFIPGKPIYMAFYLVAGTYFLLGRALDYAFAHLTVTRPHETLFMFPGDQRQVAVSFTNPTVIPFGWVSAHDRIPLALKAGIHRGWVLSLTGRQSTTVSYPIAAKTRGVHTLGPLQVYAGEPLGLHKRQRELTLNQDVVVYPRVHSLASLQLPAQLPVGNLKPKRPLQSDPSRLHGVRPYQAGDPLRSVHWPATARTQALQVKDYERTAAMEAVVVLDFNEDAFSVQDFSAVSELSVETAASLAAHLAAAKQSFTLWSNAPLGTIPMGKSNAQLMRILTALAHLELRPTTKFPRYIKDASAQLAWGSSLLVVVPADSTEVLDSCLQLQRRGFQVLLFVTGQRLEHPQLLLPKSPLHCYHVRRSQGIVIDQTV